MLHDFVTTNCKKIPFSSLLSCFLDIGFDANPGHHVNPIPLVSNKEKHIISISFCLIICVSRHLMD